MIVLKILRTQNTKSANKILIHMILIQEVIDISKSINEFQINKIYKVRLNKFQNPKFMIFK